MIFSVPGHIEMITNGLFIAPCKPQSLESLIHTHQALVKTETRRPKRGIYKVGRDYTIQRKRGVKAISGVDIGVVGISPQSRIRIVMDRIWEEKYVPGYIHITEEDAWAEGGYTPEEFERQYDSIYPSLGGGTRWVFEFHVIEVI